MGLVLDSGFNSGIDGYTYALVLPGDGKILVGGWFLHLGGKSQSNLGRLGADGSLDTDFTATADDAVNALAMQPDGKILVGGKFTTLAGQPRSHIGRLNADGTLDGSFNPGADNAVLTLAVQPDGKILVGGKFTQLAGQAQALLGRLNADGSPDKDFKGNGVGYYVASLALQTDGKIVAGGRFSSLGGGGRNNLGRLNPDGTSDNGFGFGPGSVPEVFGGLVNVVTIQPDGQILVGGSFAELGGQPRPALGRLQNTGPAEAALDWQEDGVTWLRGGTGPEVWRATLDYSTDGVNWTNLGPGTRIASGWQWSGSGGKLLPNDTVFLRPRGFVAGSGLAEWFLEGALRMPAVPLEIHAYGVTHGVFGFQVKGAPGQVVEIQASLNLLEWSTIATNGISNDGSCWFSDPAWASKPSRFYRAKQETP